jgi:hypothetical protein
VNVVIFCADRADKLEDVNVEQLYLIYNKVYDSNCGTEYNKV